MGAATAKASADLPGFFFETRSHVPFVNEEKRLVPVDMHYPDRITDTITYHLPDGMAVEAPYRNRPKSLGRRMQSWPQPPKLIRKIMIADSIVTGFTRAQTRGIQELCVPSSRKLPQPISSNWCSLRLSAVSPAKGN